jgi:hypothetical protein
MTRCWISQGYLLRFWDIPRISQIRKIRNAMIGYLKSMKEILKSENLEWDIPTIMNDKSRVSFFVLGYLSLSHPILAPKLFSRMQLVCLKSCLAQPNVSFRYSCS